ncbi:Apoptosis-inducing factor-like A [Porphyridium purpureum]|uniref:Apoptosis-inducing factor-like A n=1 Tax=Porphyridium purpureum TaxID=35688 RepID=A0A5J4Z2K0_PORPP|nr:Apoptosis-inducing factor-like A [Porphyridium purpureum]|eukprot:POR9080..scf208_2
MSGLASDRESSRYAAWRRQFFVDSGVVMDKQVVVIGGGSGGAVLAHELTKAGFKNVTLVDRKDYFEVTYASNRVLVDPALGERQRMHYAKLLKCKFQHGEVAELEEKSVKLKDGSRVPFDFAIVATGASYKDLAYAKGWKTTTIVERKAEVSAEHERLHAAKEVLIIGGGPTGVELAGEIAFKFPDKSVTLAHGTDRLLPGLSPKASAVALKNLQALNVNVLLSKRLSKQDEAYKKADVVYTCVGYLPNTELMQASFASKLDKDGRITVDDKLRIYGYEHLFAIGDCANVAEGKQGYSAMMQAKTCTKNMVAVARGKPLKTYKTHPPGGIVSTGPKTGVAQTPLGITSVPFFINVKNKDLFIGMTYKSFGVAR